MDHTEKAVNVPRFVRVFGKLGAIMRCQDNKLREAA